MKKSADIQTSITSDEFSNLFVAGFRPLEGKEYAQLIERIHSRDKISTWRSHREEVLRVLTSIDSQSFIKRVDDKLFILSAVLSPDIDKYWRIELMKWRDLRAGIDYGPTLVPMLASVRKLEKFNGSILAIASVL